MELQALVGLLKRRWWIFALTFVVGVAGAVSVSRSTPKTYQASARLFISIPTAGSVQEQLQGVQLSTQLLASYAKVLNSQATTELIASALNDQLSADEVGAHVSASVIPETVLIDVHATEHDPKLSAALANAAATALTTVIGDLDAAKSGGVAARVINKADVPTSPISPKPKRNLAFGGIIGLIVGAAAALALDSLDRTIKSPAQAAEVFGAPVLGSVPRQRRLSDEPLVAVKGAGSPMGEAYRALRTSVRFRDMGKTLHTILVTSPAAGDGKTTVAANLAIAISQDGQRVILIDGDLRRTRLNEVFKLEAGAPGLTSVLLGRAALKDALVPWSRSLSLLQTGPTLVYPSEALGSDAMVKVLKEASKIADVVIIDAPPVLPVTDPVVLSALVDGTIIVCRWGRTSLHAAEATRLALEGTRAGADVIGVVLNAEGGGRSANYYRHYSTRPAHFRAATTRPATGAASAPTNTVPTPPVTERETPSEVS